MNFLWTFCASSPFVLVSMLFCFPWYMTCWQGGLSGVSQMPGTFWPFLANMKTSESYSELGHELYNIQQFVDQDIKSFLNHGILCMENVHLTQEWSIFSSPKSRKHSRAEGIDCFQWTKYDLNKYQPILGLGVECFETSLEIWETLLGWVGQNVVSISPSWELPICKYTKSFQIPSHFSAKIWGNDGERSMPR